jgi:hypothetical protein
MIHISGVGLRVSILSPEKLVLNGGKTMNPTVSQAFYLNQSG